MTVRQGFWPLAKTSLRKKRASTRDRRSGEKAVVRSASYRAVGSAVAGVSRPIYRRSSEISEVDVRTPRSRFSSSRSTPSYRRLYRSVTSQEAGQHASAAAGEQLVSDPRVTQPSRPSPRFLSSRSRPTYRTQVCVSDSEPFHAGFKGRRLDAKLFGRAAGTANAPAAALQRPHDVAALSLVERPVTRFAGLELMRPVTKLDLQDGPMRQDHRAFDHVAKLSYIARPGIVNQRAHRFRRNLLDLLSHRIAEFLDEGPRQKRNVLGAFAQGR